MDKEILSRIAKLEGNRITKQLEEIAIKVYNEIKEKELDNDQLVTALDNLLCYCWRVPKIALQIVKYILFSLPEIKPKVKKIRGLRNIEGSNEEEVKLKALDVLEQLRYCKTKEVLRVLFRITTGEHRALKQKSLGIIKGTCAYNINAIERIGYGAQKEVISFIRSLSENERKKYVEAVIVATQTLLSPEMDGQEMSDEKTMTLLMGSVEENKDTEFIRSSAITFLKELYYLVEPEEQSEIILALYQATNCSMRGSSDNFKQLVVKNTNEIFTFFVQIIPKANNIVVRTIEKRLYWIKKQFKKNEIKDFTTVVNLIRKLKKYQVFRVLYDRDLSDEEYNHLDWTQAAKRQQEEVEKLIAGMDEDNMSEYIPLIDEVIEAYMNYKNITSESFRIFLFDLGKDKPSLAKRLLSDSKIKKSEILLSELLSGLWEGDRASTKGIMESWISKGSHLESSARVFDSKEALDLDILNKIFDKADKNAEVLRVLSIVLSKGFKKDTKNTINIKNLFVKTVEKMTKIKETSWVRYFYCHEDGVLSLCDTEDWKIILDNLLYILEIDYDVEKVLLLWIKEKPGMIIDFFENRFEIAMKKKSNSRYRAVPFHFDNEQFVAELKVHKKILIPKLLIWMGDSTLMRIEAGYMLKNLFTIKELDDYVLTELKNFTTNDEKLIESLVYLYQGHISLDSEWIRKYIKKFYNKKKKMRTLMSLMSMPGGIIEGEYGMANQMEEKLRYLETLEEKDDVIARFIEDYKKFLKEMINYEIKQTKQEILIREKSFNM